MSALAVRDPLDGRPGRTCPLSYRYSPRVFDREPELVADTLYVVGGVYGNVESMRRLLQLADAEPGGATVVFNGDFHWFDIDCADYGWIDRHALAHAALRGNVETEIAHDDSGAGCGCAYPSDVSDAEVSCSNQILARLRATAVRAAGRELLGSLPMHLTARVGDARIGIVHGDATSLAGWGFAHHRLANPAHERWVEAMFREARVDVFASTHTCLPALREFTHGVVANNGAAGMPNYAGTRFGLLTRISLRPSAAAAVCGVRHAGVYVDAVRIEYDHDRWCERFLASWPAGSPAHDSYYRRIVDGPRFALAA